MSGEELDMLVVAVALVSVIVDCGVYCVLCGQRLVDWEAD